MDHARAACLEGVYFVHSSRVTLQLPLFCCFISLMVHSECKQRSVNFDRLIWPLTNLNIIDRESWEISVLVIHTGTDGSVL